MLSAVLKSVNPSSAEEDLKSAKPSPEKGLVFSSLLPTFIVLNAAYLSTRGATGACFPDTGISKVGALLFNNDDDILDISLWKSGKESSMGPDLDAS